MNGQKRKAELDGVAETTLWTLHHRALAAKDPGSALRDPKAIEVIDAVDYPFEGRFGTGNWGFAQGMAVRARCYDREVGRFLRDHPDGTVVSLGEGLETQFWRVDNGRVRWLGVDLPEVAELRQRLLPDAPRHRTLPCSATDTRWMDEVDATRAVLIIAQGMLMYLPRDVVHRLIEACADRFPGASLVFDTPPAWMAARTERGRWKYPAGYRPPPMLWGMTPAEQRKLRTVHPNVAAVRAVRAPRGRGFLCGWLLPLADFLPAIRTRKPLWVTRVSFGPTQQHQGVNR